MRRMVNRGNLNGKSRLPVTLKEVKYSQYKLLYTNQESTKITGGSMETHKFKKNQTPIPFSQLRWLGLARDDKKSFKEALKLVQIRKGDAVCTDGKRLHRVAQNFDLKPGLYTFEKFSKSEIVLTEDKNGWKFPEVDGLFESSVLMSKANGSVGIVLPQDHDSAFAVLARLALTEDHTLNFYYLENVMSAETVFTVYHGTSGQALYFTSEIYSALVMPKLMKEIANGRIERPANNGAEPVSAKA